MSYSQRVAVSREAADPAAAVIEVSQSRFGGLPGCIPWRSQVHYEHGFIN